MVLVTACFSEPVTSPEQDFLLNTAAACIAPPANLASWWPGDGDANDIVAGNEGALQGGTGFGAGMVGQAFLLDGIDDYVGAGNDPSLHVSSGDFTVDAWVLFNDLDHPPGGNTGTTQQGDMSIVDKMRFGGNGDGWRLIKQTDNRFWFCLGNGSNGCGGFSSPTTVVSTTVVTTGVWYHVAAVKSAAGIAIYVNGAQQHAKALPSFVDTHNGSLRIGSNVTEGAHLNGLIDEVDIFNRALSATEIAAIYNAASDGKCKDTPPPPPPPPPPPSSVNSCAVAEYRFNETGTTAPSAGSDPTILLLKDRNGNAVDLHGAVGSGVSGLSEDRAFDNRASDWAGFGGVGVQPSDNEALDRFSSFTVQGWFKGDDGQSVTGNLARLVEKTDGFAEGGGWGVDWAPTQPYGRPTGSIGFGLRGEGGAGGFVSPASYLSQGQWIFFAVTYDGTASSNNVKFYRGTVSQALHLVATGTAAFGTERGSASPMSVGNGANRERAFDGLLDNIRIFGVKSGNAGVLAMTELEAIRAADASNTVVDTDDDGLGNSCDLDDDGDGYTDANEIAAGSDPLNAASTPEVCDGSDNDLDGVTDEGFPNADGDSQADCVDADDDNDGVTDVAEVAAGSDPFNAASTPEVCDGVNNDLDSQIDEGFPNTDGDAQADCVDPDDDGDGFSDVDEIASGSNPLNAASTPEVCDGLDNDLDGQVDDVFTDTDNDTLRDCVDPDDDNDNIHDEVDESPLVAGNRFRYNNTSGAITRVPTNGRIVLTRGAWPSGIFIHASLDGAVIRGQIFEMTFDNKQYVWQTPCYDCVPNGFVGQVADPPAQMRVQSITGSSQMAAMLNGVPNVVSILAGGEALITEYTTGGVLTDVTVQASGVTGGVLVNGVSVPVGATTTAGALAVKASLSGGKAKSLNLTGTFTPGASSDGLNPLTEHVVFLAGSYSWVLPPGSFTQASDGALTFQGSISGVQLGIQLKRAQNGTWSVKLNANPVSGITVPTVVGVRIGNDVAAGTG